MPEGGGRGGRAGATTVEPAEDAGFVRGDEARYPKLKPGPGMEPAEVAAHQRRRIRGATIDVVHADGYQEFTISDVIAAASVSRATFYRLYPGDVGQSSKEQCFLDAYDAVLGWIARRMRCGQARRSGAAGLVSRLGSFTGALADDPKAGHLALIGILGSGPTGLRHVEKSVDRLEPLLREAITEGRQDVDLPPLLIRGILAGVSRVSRVRLLEGRYEELKALGPQLAHWTLLCCEEDSGKTGTRIAVKTAVPQVRVSRRTSSERARMMAAALDIVGAESYAALSVPRIRRATGVSRRAFDAQFGDATDCFLTAVEKTILQGLGELRRDLLQPDWESGLARAIGRLCGRLAGDPVLAHTLAIEALAPGGVAITRRAELIGSVAECLRGTLPPERRPSDLAMDASMGAAWGVIQHHIVAGQTRELPRQAPLLTALIARPARDGDRRTIAENRCRSA